MKLIYVAHPFSGNPANLDRAESWVAFLCSRFDALFWAPWIPLCRHWPDSGDSRKRGLELDLDAVRRSDGLIAVGGEMSAGMRLERDAANCVFDASNLDSPFQVLHDLDGLNLDLIGNWIRTLQLGRARS